MKKLFLLILVVGLMLGVATTAYAHRGVHHYTARLSTLNNSGVSGWANLTLDGDQLTVSIHATGLEANMPHAQHIHGSMDNKGNATCPTAAADTNGDGVVDIGEGLPFYGPVLLPLTPFSNTPDGTLNFSQTYTINVKDLKPRQTRAIVLHGLTVNGTYIGSLPVACGQIRPGEGGED